MLVLAGCTGTSRQPQLVAMDSLLLSRPDSALKARANNKLFGESSASTLERNLMNSVGLA